MKGRGVPCLLVVIAAIALAILLLAGCGETAQEEQGEVASPEEGDITSYGDGYRYDYNGWVYLHIEGEPYERGFQHGYLMAPELAEIMEMVEYTTFQDTGKEWGFFVEQAERIFMPNAEEEYVEEMKGIADGATQAGTEKHEFLGPFRQLQRHAIRGTRLPGGTTPVRLPGGVFEGQAHPAVDALSRGQVTKGVISLRTKCPGCARSRPGHRREVPCVDRERLPPEGWAECVYF